MSDVLPQSNQEPLPAGPGAPRKDQAAIERLRKRMEGYREMQSSRMPQYENHVNHHNGQQVQETLALRQKFLESKAKKPNKKSSASASQEKMKHEMQAAAQGMNGMMQYHNGPPAGGPQMNGPPMGHTSGPMGNGPNGPMPNGPMVPNGPMMHHGPQGPVKRPLDEDDRTIQADTAKRLNLENGAISDQNFMKREPSPMDTKYNPGGAQFRGSPHHQQGPGGQPIGPGGPSHGGPGGPPHGPGSNPNGPGGPPHGPGAPTHGQPGGPSHGPGGPSSHGPGGPSHGGPPNSGANSQASPGTADVKPNVNTLNKDMESSSSQSDSSKTPQSSSQNNEAGSDKEKVKEEVNSDSFKKEAEDTLGEFDLKDFDFDGMNNDTLQDLMDAVGDDLTENFIENFDFESSSKMESDVKSEELKPDGDGPPTSSGAPTAPTPSTSTAGSAPSRGAPPSGGQAPNAAEALKMMAQQHQQPPASGAPGPPYPGPGAPYAMHPANRGPGGPQGYMPPNSSAMPGAPPGSHPGSHGSPGPGSESGGPPSQSPHHPSQSPGDPPNMGPVMGPRPPGMQEGDPRLRAAVQQRFRLGNPQSMAGSMGGPGGGPGGPGGPGGGQPGMQGHPGMMANQRMPGMMQMSGSGMMMNQQQQVMTVLYHVPVGINK